MTAVDVHAVVDGPEDAPVVVLAGSLGSTLEMWDPQVPALAERFRVVRYDARGHGRSPVPPGSYAVDDLADDAVALLDRLGVERASFVGLSLGGMAAMRLAAREPQRVDRLVLLCTSARLGPAAGWEERAATVRAHGTGAVAPAVVTRWLTDDLRAADPALVQRLEAMVAGTPSEGYAACCDAILAMDLRDDLRRIVAPTLAIAGADDPATPPEHLRDIADAVPGAQLLVLPSAAHLANLEQVAALDAALLLHLGAPSADARHHAQGTAVRRAVLGDAHVDRAVAGTTPLTAPFQDLITRYAWGDVWSRPGLDRRTRSMLTLALLTALGAEHELGMHVRGAVTHGLTTAEIGEVLLHSAVYAGVPAANRALAVAERELGELGLDGGRRSGRRACRRRGVPGSDRLGHPQVRQRDLELGDVDELPRGRVERRRAQVRRGVPGPLERLPALVRRGRGAAARGAVDEQAEAAEARQVLDLGDHRRADVVQLLVDALRSDACPGDAGARAGRHGPLAVQDGDLPLAHLGPVAEQLRGPVAQGRDRLRRRPHRLLALPRAGDDRAAGLAVDEHGQADAAVHPLDGGHDLVAHERDAGVDVVRVAPEGGGPRVHGDHSSPVRGTPPVPPMAPPCSRPPGATRPSCAGTAKGRRRSCGRPHRAVRRDAPVPWRLRRRDRR